MLFMIRSIKQPEWCCKRKNAKKIAVLMLFDIRHQSALILLITLIRIIRLSCISRNKTLPGFKGEGWPDLTKLGEIS